MNKSIVNSMSDKDLVSVSQRYTCIHPFVVLIVSFLVYAMSMPLTIALEDDGLFILSSYYNGVSHSPGYPLHSFIGHLFTHIPISTVAARVHAVSALFGALTCAMVWIFINELAKNRLISYIGSLSYAFSLEFWSQAIIAEVYTLNTFFFFALLYLTYRIYKLEMESINKSRVEKLMYLSAFIFGLSLSNHWPLMLIASPCYFVFVLNTIKRTPVIIVKSIPFIVIGLTPYYWMVVNSQSDPFISFMGPINNWTEFYDFVSRQRYALVDNSSSSGPVDKLNYIVFYFSELTKQFSYIGFPFVLAGFFVQFTQINKTVCLALITGFATNILFIIGLLHFDYDMMHKSIISVYFIVSYGVSSIWLSLGLYYAYSRVNNISFIRKRLGVLSLFIVGTMVVFIIIANLPTNNRHDYEWGRAYARAVLESLPKQSLLVLHGDVAIGTIGYTHFIEGIRPDIKVVSDSGLIFQERLFNPVTILEINVKHAVEDYISNYEGPVYSVSYDAELYGHDHWLTRQYVEGSKKGEQVLHLKDLNNEYLSYIYNYDANDDVWTNVHRNDLLISAIPYIFELSLLGKSIPVYEDIITEVVSELRGYVILIEYLVQKNLVDRYGGLDRLLVLADDLYSHSNEKRAKAEYLHLRGKLELEAENMESSIVYFTRSVEMWKNINNRSLPSLAELYKSSGREVEYNKYLHMLGAEFVEEYNVK